MEIEKEKQLASLTTFGVEATSTFYAEYSSLRELEWLSRQPEYLNHEVIHIGGGSNILFIGSWPGLVIRSAIKGITTYPSKDGRVFVIAGAGEKWTDLVEWTIAEGLAGLENLSGIPGSVGAAPVQNVGAYGVEAGDRIFSVECFDTLTRKTISFKAADCQFGYRDSRFKHDWKGRYYVLRVSFLLDRSDKASELSYGPLKSLADRLGHTPSPAEVAEEVKKIRNEKLPDPEELGSAGSYFKNPVVHAGFFKERVLPLAPDMPYHNAGEKRVKLSAAWLIDHAGLKGRSIGNAEVYPKQPLVIVNRGGATGKEVRELGEEVRSIVHQKIEVLLKPEVNIIDPEIKVTVFGSGTSKGVPEIGCPCSVCSSEDPRDKRLRSSVLVETRGLKILIDASPDFRQQMLRSGTKELDALIVTHSHQDHVGGMDDLRPFCMEGAFPIYLRPDVAHDLRTRFEYCFRPAPWPGAPVLDLKEISDSPFLINGLKIIPVEVHHGPLPIFGYRIGNFAYITDAKTIAESEKEKLRDLDVLVLNALRYRDHFSHLTLEEALALIEELKPKRAYLTHMSHDIGLHAELEKRLPENVKPAYDGLVITC